MHIKLSLSLTVALLFIFAPAALAAEKPPVFADMEIPAAVGAAADKSDLVIIKFTAEWCMPCKMMDQTSWIDPKVVAWVEEHGVALAVDVDNAPKVAREYNVQAMPTMVAVRGGEQFDRIIGYASPEELLDWFGLLERGEKQSDRVADLIERDLEHREELHVGARYDLAKRLIRAERYEEALEECIWLWHNMAKRDPSMHGVRLSFFMSDVQRLMAAYPPAIDAFRDIRDELTEQIDSGDTSFSTLNDWAELNDRFGEQDLTLAWYAKHRDDPRMERAIGAIKRDLRDLFVERDMWQDYAETLDTPIREFRTHIQSLNMERGNLPPVEAMSEEDWQEIRDELRTMSDQRFRDNLSKAYAAYLSIGQDKHAATTARVLLKNVPGDESRKALARWAITAEAANDELLAILDEVETKGPETDRLREKARTLITPKD